MEGERKGEGKEGKEGRGPESGVVALGVDDPAAV